MIKITDYLKVNLFARTVKTFNDVDSVHVNYGRNEVVITCKHSLSGSLPFNIIVDSFNERFLARNL